MDREMSHIGETLTCEETGKQFIGAQVGCTTNYATDREGRIFSDEGVDLREKRELLDRSGPFTCYVSSDGKHMTGWKGNVLGDVVSSRSVRLAWRSFTHGSHMHAYRFRDVHGGLWRGRGSPGICINVRPLKG